MATIAVHPHFLQVQTERDAGARAERGTAWRSRLFAWHELLLGRRTLALARQLDESQAWPPERIAALQVEKLRRMIEYAARHCPLYRDAWRGSHGQTAFFHPTPEKATRLMLAAMPLLTREDVRRSAGLMCSRRRGWRRMADHSSGTSEAALRYYWDRDRQAWDKANRIRGHGWFGFPEIGGELHLWPVDPPRTARARVGQWLRVRRDRLLDDRQINSGWALSLTNAANSSLTPSHSQRERDFWQAWRAIDPARVTAYPSVLCELIAAGMRARLPIGNPRLQRVFLTGEVTFDWQRTLIERALGVPTTNVYGVQEAGAIAFACAAGSWHTCAESCLVEYVRDGRTAGPGELAEVVVTALESFTMPMIRYCTGDIVRLPIEQQVCPCGRGQPVMPPVLGRAGDFLEHVGGEWIAPADVLRILNRLLPAGGYQVVQGEAGDVTVRVAGATSDRRWWEHEVKHAVDRMVGGAGVRIEAVAALERSTFGKRRYVQSRRTGRGLAADPRA